MRRRTRTNLVKRVVIVYSRPQSDGLQEEPWQTNQRRVRTHLAGAPNRMTANIAAQLAKELATPFSLTATAVTRIAPEISRATTRQFEKGRTTRPFLVSADGYSTRQLQKLRRELRPGPFVFMFEEHKRVGPLLLNTSAYTS